MLNYTNKTKTKFACFYSFAKLQILDKYNIKFCHAQLLAMGVGNGFQKLGLNP